MKYFATLSMATMAAAQMQVMSLAAAPSPAGAMTHSVRSSLEASKNTI
jgi:hypothetical protein